MEEMNLEEMRSQITILKEKVDKQAIVNDQLIHNVVNTHTSDIKRKVFVAIVCGLLTICMSPFAFHHNLGLSWMFVIATDILMIYCISMEMYYKRMIADKTLMNASVLEVAQTVSRFKSGYKRYTLINWVVLLPIWLIWMFVEMYFNFSDNMELFWAMAAGLGVGIVVGGIIGLRLFLRIIDNADQIIKEINE
ncbi:MAG: hypothetical protein J5735_05890 [Prevotella sp.]|nr:hypothetical protein [Prevotella sp.]